MNEWNCDFESLSTYQIFTSLCLICFIFRVGVLWYTLTYLKEFLRAQDDLMNLKALFKVLHMLYYLDHTRTFSVFLTDSSSSWFWRPILKLCQLGDSWFSWLAHSLLICSEWRTDEMQVWKCFWVTVVYGGIFLLILDSLTAVFHTLYCGFLWRNSRLIRMICCGISFWGINVEMR